jgi:RNA polymerase sigma-70 factor (ECF subfamily)
MHEEHFASESLPENERRIDESSFGGNLPSEGLPHEGLPSEGKLLHAAREESSAKRGRYHPKYIENGNQEGDESLFLRYQGGDDRAFLLIYERYKESIFAYCAQVLMSAGIGRDIVEDTFQDVFMRLAQYRQTFTGGEFKAWIFTVARHSCISAKKAAYRQRTTMEQVGTGDSFDDDESMEVRMAFSLIDDPLDRMSRAEQAQLLTQAIARLPEEFREALIMSEYDGLTYDEIAKITSTTLATVRIRIYRAKHRLRKMLLPIIGDDAPLRETAANEDA